MSGVLFSIGGIGMSIFSDKFDKRTAALIAGHDPDAETSSSEAYPAAGILRIKIKIEGIIHHTFWITTR
jgi:hypothetical protein